MLVPGSLFPGAGCQLLSIRYDSERNIEAMNKSAATPGTRQPEPGTRPLLQFAYLNILPPDLDSTPIMNLEGNRSFTSADLLVLDVYHLLSVEP